MQNVSNITRLLKWEITSNFRFDSSTDNINDGIPGGPLALFNKAGKTIVISPYNNYMAASVWHANKPGGHVAWGIMGGVDEIPQKFSYSTLLVFSGGINKVYMSRDM